MPILPCAAQQRDHIIKLDNHICIKILKTLGPLSIFIFISGLIKQLENNVIIYLILIVSILYFLYKKLIAYYAVKQ